MLRTLAPALRELERTLRAWLAAAHRFPLSTLQRATIEGLADDFKRQADALLLDQPLLIIMLMGGTGVGKSTLLNALAGGAIAQASFARPTTRDPVVYYHESIQPHRLDPALQQCKLVAHDRPVLEQKILVDTPDIDSNDLANREKLHKLLPVADVVLYVGSQEKYHDKIGWDLFLKQRQRRAFAFVLNKWDRCLHPGATGLRPDEDLLNDLQAQGFVNPLLFRTCAQYWVDQQNHAPLSAGRGASPAPPLSPFGRAAGGEESPPSDGQAQTSPAHPPLPEGEQFPDLVHWLEMGLSRLEIEAIKARGVSQLLRQAQQALEAACPPDLKDVAAKTKTVWQSILSDEARAAASVLLSTLDPYQREIEHFFALERQRQFRGIMGTYLSLFNKIKYTGSTLRQHIPLLPHFGAKAETAPTWSLSHFTQACTSVASERHLDARSRALGNKLLIEADRQGFPLTLLNEPTEATARIDWRSRYAQALADVLGQVEQIWSRPSGARRWFQAIIIFLADWLPLLAIGGMGLVLLWQYIVDQRPFAWGDLLLPVAVMVMMIVVLHVLIVILLPLRWLPIRTEFEKHLEHRLREELEHAYCGIPLDVAEKLLEERKQVEHVLKDLGEVASWLEQREQAASIAGLYGK